MSGKASDITSKPIQPLLTLLRDKLLPWLQGGQLHRVLIAQTVPRVVSLSPEPVNGVAIGNRTRRGRAVTVKASRGYGYTNATMRWPEDRLVAARHPIVACVLRGNAELHLGNYSLHLSEGRLLVIPAGMPYSDGSVPHLPDSNPEGFCDILWIFPWRGGVVCNVCHSHGGEHRILDEGEACFITDKQAVSYLSAALEEAVSRDDLSGPICHGLLTTTVLLLIRELEAGRFAHSGYAARGVRESRADHNPIAQAQEYVCLHLDKPLTIDRVARLCYMSRAQFTKEFRAVTGKSFNQFLTEQRLAEAQRLLSDTELPVCMIGEFVGLQPMHLRRLFRQHLHANPSAFRDSSWRSRPPAGDIEPHREAQCS